MKNKLKYILATIFLSTNNLILAFADTDMAANQLLGAILDFLQYCSYLILVFGIGMFIYSIKNADGARKVDSLKVLGVALLLFGLKKVAEVGGLI